MAEKTARAAGTNTQAVQTKNPLFDYSGKPTFAQIAPLGLQHVVAAVVGVITPAIIVGNICGLSQNDLIILIQISLVASALSTLLQLFPIGPVGARLPVVIGTSFAYIPTLSAIGAQYGIGAVLGSTICGGIAAVVVGVFVKQIRPLFPPLVTGTVIFTIGLSLYPTAVRYMAGGNQATNPLFGAWQNWLVAGVVLLVVIFLNNFTKGIAKLASILIAMVIGYAIALPLGLVDLSPVATASWLYLPTPMHFGIEFVPAAIISMVIMFIVNAVQAIGDLSSTTLGGMDRMPTDKELSGGIIANGVTSSLGALFGALPNATYSQNVGIVTVTRVINRLVLAFAAVVLLVAGFLPKVGGVLTTIPQCVIGGATISVFASIAMTGMRMIASAGLTPRNTAVVGLAVALGVGVNSVPNALSGFPTWVHTIFGASSVVMATIMAIILNLVLPKDAPAAAAEAEAEAGDAPSPALADPGEPN